MKLGELWKQLVQALAPRSKSQDRRRMERLRRKLKQDEQRKREKQQKPRK